MSRSGRLLVERCGWNVLTTAGGLALSARILPTVSLTTRGLVIATAVIAIPLTLGGETIRHLRLDEQRLGRPPYVGEVVLWWVLFTFNTAWLGAAVPVASHVTPGFIIEGFWATVETILAIYVAVVVFYMPHWLLTRGRRTS